jgi:O-antigen/teichoic acid export membrane protein
VTIPKICRQVNRGSDHIRSLFRRFAISRMIRQAAWLFILNIVAKGSLFIGCAYAAKCLGPRKLGVSAMVYSVSQLVVVLAGGGLDTVAVRRIAADPMAARSITHAIIRFRMGILFIISPFVLFTSLYIAPPSDAIAWISGTVLSIATCFGISFVFQGLERLPLQAFVSVLTSGLSALAYFQFERGQIVGSDLAVMALAGSVGAGLSYWLFYSLVKCWPCGSSVVEIKELLRESKPYWLLALTIYCYNSLQIPLVNYLAGDTAVGVYRSALLFSNGLDLLYYSLNALLLPRLVAWRQLGATYLWYRQKELMGMFICLGSGVSLCLIWFAPKLYHEFFGEDFMEAVIPFQILVVGRMVVFVGQIFAWSLTALRLDRQFLIASLTGAIFSVASTVIVLPRYGIIAVAIVNVLSEVVVCAASFVMVRNEINRLINLRLP